MKKLVCFSFILFFLALGIESAMAAPVRYVNEEFTSGDFNGGTVDGNPWSWTTIVNPATVPTALSVKTGSYWGRNDFDGVPPNPASSDDINQALISTNYGAATPKTAAEVDAFAHLSSGFLNTMSTTGYTDGTYGAQGGYGWNAINGTAIQLQVDTTGATLPVMFRFDYDFITKDLSYQDFAFVSVVRGDGTVESVHIIADTSQVKNVIQVIPQVVLDTGYIQYDDAYVADGDAHGYSYQLQNTGSYYLTIGVVNVFDSGRVSELLIDNLQVAEVPEPVSLLLVGTGLFGLAGIRRKSRKS